MYFFKDEQESIKALICGDSFMPKLLETVTNSENDLTDRQIAMLKGPSLSLLQQYTHLYVVLVLM